VKRTLNEHQKEDSNTGSKLRRDPHTGRPPQLEGRVGGNGIKKHVRRGNKFIIFK
jgi:hypothetical protein